MISIIPVQKLSAVDIKYLRSISSCGISEIMEAAKNQTAIRDIHVFAGEWETERAALAKIYEHCSSNAERPYWIKESDEYGLDELLSPELLKKRIDHWRSIELETQMSTDLELGEINDPSEFIPHDDDWT